MTTTTTPTSPVTEELNQAAVDPSLTPQERVPAGEGLWALEALFFKKLEAAGKSRNTLKNYRTDLECFNQFLTQTQKKMDISHFGQEEILEYGNYLQKRYTSDNSRRRRVQALRIFFDFLVEQGHFNSNPVRKIPTSPKFLDIPRPTPMNDVVTLWAHLLEEIKSHRPMEKLLAYRNMVTLVLIYGGGLKVSDLTNLKLAHVTQSHPPRIMVVPDRRDPYTVELPEVFNPVLSEYLQLLEQMKAHSNIQFDHLLFNANPYRILAGGLSARGLEIIFEEFRKKLSITLTPKSLRQACIFKWLHQKRPDALIKEWMGVAPSYGLKLYKEHAQTHLYNEDFLERMYRESVGRLN